MTNALLVVELIALGLTWVVVYHLMKQQGRLLLRLDSLQQQIAQLRSAESPPAELQVGTPFPAFQLSDLSGQFMSLDDLHGNRAMLVNWDPSCTFCQRIAPDLAALQAPLTERRIQLVLISQGDEATNRQMAEVRGLTVPILLQKPGQVVEPFRVQGTPVAYVLDPEGKVAQAMAVGADEVLEAATRLANAPREITRVRLAGERPLSTSRIERDGLPPGTPAPRFQLPEIGGRTVRLEDYRGKQVLLVFSDPHCLPCEQIAHDLVRLRREHRDNGLAVVMISRGNIEENRQKAKTHGFDFPVALQKNWEISKEYGIFVTPSAFLVDADGVIAGTVARGVDEIRSLAQTGLAAAKEREYEPAI